MLQSISGIWEKTLTSLCLARQSLIQTPHLTVQRLQAHPPVPVTLFIPFLELSKTQARSPSNLPVAPARLRPLQLNALPIQLLTKLPINLPVNLLTKLQNEDPYQPCGRLLVSASLSPLTLLAVLLRVILSAQSFDQFSCFVHPSVQLLPP